MDKLLSKLSRTAALPCFEEILERHYAQMQDWVIGLTRGDLEKAEDIVHGLCLHLALTGPDLSRVENFEGYLLPAYAIAIYRTSTGPPGGAAIPYDGRIRLDPGCPLGAAGGRSPSYTK